MVSSCKKETSNQTQYYQGKISSSLHPYLFDVGSYWVYKDTANSNLDSIALKNVQRTTFVIGPSHPGQGYQGDEEYFDMEYLSSYSASYHEQLFGYVISKALYNGGYVFLSSKTKGDSLANALIVDVIDSIKIENNVYRNVTKMKITNDTYINGNFNFYYADSVGVIRKETIVNNTVTQTWNLIRYKAVLLKY